MGDVSLALSDRAVAVLHVADELGRGPNVAPYFDVYFDFYLALPSGAALVVSDDAV